MLTSHTYMYCTYTMYTYHVVQCAYCSTDLVVPSSTAVDRASSSTLGDARDVSLASTVCMWASTIHMGDSTVIMWVGTVCVLVSTVCMYTLCMWTNTSLCVSTARV